MLAKNSVVECFCIVTVIKAVAKTIWVLYTHTCGAILCCHRDYKHWIHCFMHQCMYGGTLLSLFTFLIANTWKKLRCFVSVCCKCILSQITVLCSLIYDRNCIVMYLCMYYCNISPVTVLTANIRQKFYCSAFM